MPETGEFVPLGAEWKPASTTFSVFSPTSAGVSVVLYAKAKQSGERRELPLERQDDGTWRLTVRGNLEGLYYTFRFTSAGGGQVREGVDINAINTVDSARRARITDLAKTNPPNWREKGRVGPRLASPVDAIVWEMHVRDMTSSATSGVAKSCGYLGWTEAGTCLPERPDIRTCLDHVAELGATHVQLLPVQNYDGEERSASYFWGYMTTGFNSPEGSYASNVDDDSRIRELKELIAAVHERGMGVVLDVVYNHAGETASFDVHAPGYYFRHRPDGTRSNGSGCGNDFRSESEWGRKFIIDSLLYWVREYGVDGFRFDLMALLDRETMAQAEKALRAVKPDILLYGEPWAVEPSPMDGAPMDKGGLAGTGYGAFNDDFRNAMKGSSDGPQPGFIQSGWHRDGVREGLLGQPAWAPSPAQVIQYLTCHDNLCLYDKLVASRPETPPETRRRMAKLGYFLLLVSQGVPFLHGGDEFLRTKRGDRNSYKSSDAINQVDWRLKAEHWELFDYVRRLIALRKSHPMFRLTRREQVAARCTFHPHQWWDTIVLEIDGRDLPGETWERVLLVINGSPDREAGFTLPEGKWECVFEAGGIVSAQLVVSPQTGLILREVG